MDVNELDKLAKANEPMPKCLALHEQAYYQASRNLYRTYDLQKITVEQAREEKKLIIEEYESKDECFKLFLGIHNIADKLRQLQKEGFNTSLEFEILEDIEIFIGKGVKK